MKWYKHLSDSLNDPDISEIMDKFGSDGYVAFFGILEIMTRNFNQNDGESYTISVKYLRKSLRVSEQKLRNILTFPKFFKRISSEFSNGSVTLKCPKLLDMLETYDRQAKYREQAKLRNDYVTVTKKLRTEEEVEEEGEEEEDIKKESIKKEDCTEPKEKPISVPKVSFNFTINKWENIQEKDLLLWKEAYPACNVKLELNKMGAWLVSNPSQRKQNYKRFISGWLSRTQDKGGSKGVVTEEQKKPSFNEDTHFQCVVCKSIFPKQQREYGDKGGYCKACHSKECEVKGNAFRESWEKMTPKQKEENIKRLKKFNLPIPDWMSKSDIPEPILITTVKQLKETSQ